MASIPALLSRLKPDPFTLSLLGTGGIATVLPCIGRTAEVFGDLRALAIGLLFFLHGAKLPRDAIVAGVTHWRLHLTVLCLTFVLFPVLDLLMQPRALRMLTPELCLGMLFLCMLPSTVQSSIAFTSMARGNVAAAVCSTSASYFIGIFVIPLLVSAFAMHGAVRGRSTIQAMGPSWCSYCCLSSRASSCAAV